MKGSTSYERYQRQIILKGFGQEGQHKLMQSKVLVIGAGGLGCPALQYLVAAGVGTVGIVDDDVVSLTNLHRQVLYATEEMGLLKVDVAAKKLNRLNADVKILTYPQKLENTNAFDIISRYDLVIDGTDNFTSRYLINDACVLLKKPLIYGAVSQYEGQVSFFHPKGFTGVNYRHLFFEPPKDGEVLNCAEAGVLGMLPAIIGAMQAAEAIKFITGIGTPLLNKLLTYNVLTHDTYVVELTPVEMANELLPKNETEFLAMNYLEMCSAKQSSVIEIDAQQLHRLSKLSDAVVIDVRERGELPLFKKISHRQIPMSVFKENISTIDKQTVVLFCQHGVRSLYAAELLHEVFGKSKKVYSLKGGIVKWGEEIEKNIFEQQR